MHRSRKETQTQQFDCPKLGDIALVQLTCVSMDLGDGQEVRATSGGRCNDALRCGVGSTSANRQSWSYDYSKCVHPQLKQNP